MKGKSSILKFNQSTLTQMQHFEQIDLDNIDEFITTEDHDNDNEHEQSLMGN